MVSHYLIKCVHYFSKGALQGNYKAYILSHMAQTQKDVQSHGTMNTLVQWYNEYLEAKTQVIVFKIEKSLKECYGRLLQLRRFSKGQPNKNVINTNKIATSY